MPAAERRQATYAPDCSLQFISAVKDQKAAVCQTNDVSHSVGIHIRRGQGQARKTDATVPAGMILFLRKETLPHEKEHTC